MNETLLLFLSSLIGMVLGVFIGIALGYLIWGIDG